MKGFAKHDYSSKFRNTSGVRLTKTLFRDYTNGDTALYTLSNRDHPEGYPSLKRLYLEMEDTTEYEFAVKYFEDFDHWQTLCDTNWFKPFIAQWRQELELKLRARELFRLQRIANDSENPASFRASTYLLDKGYSKTGTKGRPSKEQVTRAAKELAEHQRSLKDDFERITDGLEGKETLQ